MTTDARKALDYLAGAGWSVPYGKAIATLRAALDRLDQAEIELRDLHVACSRIEDTGLAYRARAEAAEARLDEAARMADERDAADERAAAAEARLAEVEAALEELMAWQNGPPLVTYEEGWTAAMEAARAALAAGKEEP